MALNEQETCGESIGVLTPNGKYEFTECLRPKGHPNRKNVEGHDYAIQGVCSNCGQVLGLTPDDCWHPYTVKEACPSEPSKDLAWDAPGGWAEFYAEGKRSGRPGRDKFRVNNYVGQP